MSGHTHQNHTSPDEQAPGMARSQPASPDAVKDPVCGMDVDPHVTKHKATHGGRPYYFCSAGCETKFVAAPEKYVGPSKVEPVDATSVYTCPMHPQIRQVGPGNCPICGMALEPVVASAEAAENHELKDMTRRFWIGLVLTLPVLALEMGGHLTGLNHYLGLQASNYMQFALGTPVVLWAGWPFFVRA